MSNILQSLSYHIVSIKDFRFYRYRYNITAKSCVRLRSLNRSFHNKWNFRLMWKDQRLWENQTQSLGFHTNSIKCALNKFGPLVQTLWAGVNTNHGTPEWTKQQVRDPAGEVVSVH